MGHKTTSDDNKDTWWVKTHPLCIPKFSRKEMVWLGLRSFWRIKLQWRSNWNLLSIKNSWLCCNTQDHRSCYSIFWKAINLEWSGGKLYPESNYWNKYWSFLCDSSNFIVGTSTMCDPRLWWTQYIIHWDYGGHSTSFIVVLPKHNWSRYFGDRIMTEFDKYNH